MQDLTKITTTYGLLDEETQQALERAFNRGEPIVLFNAAGEWVEKTHGPLYPNYTYRVRPEPKTISTWVNIYPLGGGGCEPSREAADKIASSIRIAVIRIEQTEGQPAKIYQEEM